MAQAARRGLTRLPSGERPAKGDLIPPAAPQSWCDRVPARLAVVLLCLVLLGLFRARAANPLGVHMDSWTEANIVVSARNVAANGWRKYQGAAQHQVDRLPFREDPFYRYAQYPLGTYYIAWVLDSLGVHGLDAWRWPPTVLSLAALVLWYALLRRFVGRWTALVCTVVLATAHGFLDYADHIHHGYSHVMVTGTMLTFVTGVASGGRRRLLLLGTSGLLMFLNAFLSWEWCLWSQAFVWGYALLFGISFKKRWLFLFALVVLTAFAIQARQRTIALGSGPGSGFVQDFLRRTVRLEETADTPPEVTLANYPWHVVRRFGQFYGIGLGWVAALGLAWGVLRGGLRPPAWTVHAGLRLAILLSLCGLSWWCVMIQHTAVHPHVMRHALFAYALVFGLVLATGLEWVLARGRPWWSRVLAGVAVVVIAWIHGARAYQNIRLHMDPRYRDPNGWDAGWPESENLSDLARKLPADVVVLTNNNRLPPLRYWTNRPVYPATLLPYPFRRGAPLPEARVMIELTLHHLRDLYGTGMPPLVYAYFFRRPPIETYLSDVLLWQLVDGTWEQGPTAAHVDNFKQLVRGGGRSAYPVIARGRDWLCFDARELPDRLPLSVSNLPAPTRSAFGPPR